MGIFSPDVWTHCNYIAETFGDMFLTHCDTSVPTFTILVMFFALKTVITAVQKPWSAKGTSSNSSDFS